MSDLINTGNAQTDAVINAAIPAALAIAAATSPQGATIAALAPVALSVLNTAIKLQQANQMTPDALATLWKTISDEVLSTHTEWNAMNAADAAKAA